MAIANGVTSTICEYKRSRSDTHLVGLLYHSSSGISRVDLRKFNGGFFNGKNYKKKSLGFRAVP